jgi:glycosyltransferase involved in cell wall biosynthesis
LEILDSEDQFLKSAPIESRLVVDGPMVGRPRFSIMIPTFQRPDLLREAISSALDQVTEILYEVVVVDNDTTMADKTDRIVREFNNARLRLFRNAENIGMFENWNRCIELARAEWITILNDDDLLHRNFVEEMLVVVGKNKSINLLCCQSEFIDDRGRTMRRLKGRVKLKLKRISGSLKLCRLDHIRTADLYLDSLGNSLGMIFKRGHAIEVGGYKPAAFPIADYVFLVMYHLRYGACRLNKVLACYRIHENETANPATAEYSIAKSMELRKEMESHVIAPVRLLRLYSQLYALKTARQFKAFWGGDLDLEQIRQRYELTKLPTRLSYHVVRFLLRMRFAFVCVRK